MIEISFVGLETALVIVWLLVRIVLCVYRRRIDWRQELLSLALLVSVAAILRFTMFPFHMVNGKIEPLPLDFSHMFPPRLNLIPFAEFFTYDSTSDILINIIGNPAMFVPVGILLPIAYPRLNTCAKVVGTGALISLAIELVQLPFYTRVTDVNDLLLNTLGVAIGYGVYSLVKHVAGSRCNV